MKRNLTIVLTDDTEEGKNAIKLIDSLPPRSKSKQIIKILSDFQEYGEDSYTIIHYIKELEEKISNMSVKPSRTKEPKKETKQQSKKKPEEKTDDIPMIDSDFLAGIDSFG